MDNEIVPQSNQGYVYVVWQGGNFGNRQIHITINGNEVANYYAKYCFADKFILPDDDSAFKITVSTDFFNCSADLSSLDYRKGYVCNVVSYSNRSGHGKTYSLSVVEDNAEPTGNIVFQGNRELFSTRLNLYVEGSIIKRKYFELFSNRNEIIPIDFSSFGNPVNIKLLRGGVALFDKNYSNLDKNKDYLLDISYNKVSISFTPGNARLLRSNVKVGKNIDFTQYIKYGIFFLIFVFIVVVGNIAHEQLVIVPEQQKIAHQEKLEEQNRMYQEEQQRRAYEAQQKWEAEQRRAEEDRRWEEERKREKERNEQKKVLESLQGTWKCSHYRNDNYRDDYYIMVSGNIITEAVFRVNINSWSNNGQRIHSDMGNVTSVDLEEGMVNYTSSNSGACYFRFKESSWGRHVPYEKNLGTYSRVN